MLAVCGVSTDANAIRNCRLFTCAEIAYKEGKRVAVCFRFDIARVGSGCLNACSIRCIVKRLREKVCDVNILDRRGGGVADFDAIRNDVADFSVLLIGSLGNLKRRVFKKGNVERNACDVFKLNVFGCQFKAAA